LVWRLLTRPALADPFPSSILIASPEYDGSTDLGRVVSIDGVRFPLTGVGKHRRRRLGRVKGGYGVLPCL